MSSFQKQVLSTRKIWKYSQFCDFFAQPSQILHLENTNSYMPIKALILHIIQTGKVLLHL